MTSKIIVAFIVFMLVSCGTSSYITSSWKADEALPRQYKKIVVLGMVGQDNQGLREKMEQHIAGDLRDLGYNAVCSCEEFNPKSFENMTEKQAVEKLKASGVDAVVTVVMLDKIKEKIYIPANANNQVNSQYNKKFYDYYRTMYERVNQKGYYTEETKYFWESNLYDLGNSTLIWSAKSRSFDPGSSNKLSHEYGQMIVKEMVKKNVLLNWKTALKPM